MNHRHLIQKLFNIMQDSTLCRVIQNLLSNRRFYVELNNERSRWRLQKNGLPQGSVLSPTLFNIYTNDQPVHDGTKSFIYADDLCITAQFPTFSQVEGTIEDALGELTEYYRKFWTVPAGVTALLARWTEKLAGGPQAGTSDSPPTRKGHGSG